ncbi:MAG: hypothetical protein PVG42_11660, partial [Lysobacterales bacterium]
MSRYSVLAAFTISLLCCGLAVTAHAACEKEMAALDQRLESGDLNAKQREIVDGVRQSAGYLCNSGQEAQVREMLENLDAMLNAPGIGAPLPQRPTLTPSTSTAKDGTAAGEWPVKSGVSGSGQWIDRPEDMMVYWYKDTDYSNGQLRVLYRTSPSLEQGQSDAWTANVYVVEIDANGNPRQHHLYSRKALETVTMGLLPGEDKVLVQTRALGSGDSPGLQVWSVPGGNVLSNAEIPSANGKRDERWDWGGFKTISTDGNAVFTVTQFTGRRADPPVSIAAWMEVSPDGHIVGRGQNRLENARQAIRFAFPAHTGGAGLALDVSAIDDSGIDGLLDEPFEEEIGGREIRGVLGREMRLVVTGRDTSDAKFGPDLERDLIWRGEMGIPSDLPSAERMQQNQQQMRVMAETEIRAGARRHVRIIKPTTSGYGVLMRVTGNRNIPESQNGRHFTEVTLDGRARHVFLDPIGDELKVRFEDFAAGADDTIYLFADGRGRRGDYDAIVLPVTKGGETGAAIPVEVPDQVEIDQVHGAPSGLWLVGHGMNDALGKVCLWV